MIQRNSELAVGQEISKAPLVEKAFDKGQEEFHLHGRPKNSWEVEFRFGQMIQRLLLPV
jgi:hypothetical protein